MSNKAVKNKNEAKDQLYVLKGNSHPLQFFLRNRHKPKAPLQYYSEEDNTLRAMRYATNQTSVFVDEQQGDVTLEAIIFKNGKLSVPKTNPILQEFLSLHPLNGKVFELHQPEIQAERELEDLMISSKATSMVWTMEAVELESIALAISGTSVLNLKSSEIKRDMLVYAKNNPQSFINLAKDDLTKLKGLGIRAVDSGLLEYRGETFYNKDNALCRVPFDETDKFNTLSRYLKTKDGQKLLEFLNSKLN